MTGGSPQTDPRIEAIAELLGKTAASWWRYPIAERILVAVDGADEASGVRRVTDQELAAERLEFAQQEAPPLPALVGIGEAAAILGVSKQRVHQLMPQMPEPIQRLAMGPVWTEASVREYAEVRNTMPSRVAAPTESRNAPPVAADSPVGGVS